MRNFLKNLKQVVMGYGLPVMGARNFANFVNFVMQKLKAVMGYGLPVIGERVSREMDGEQPTNLQGISKESLTEGTVRVAALSSLRSMRYAFFAVLMLMVFGVGEAWGDSYSQSFVNTSTTSWNDGKISLSFSNVAQNTLGYDLSTKEKNSSNEKDANSGTMSWSSYNDGYTIKVTEAVATFQTEISTSTYGVYGKVTDGSSSQYTAKMYTKGGTGTASATIQNNAGLGSTFTFTTGRNSAHGIAGAYGKVALKSLSLTYTRTPNTYTIAYNGNGSTHGSTASTTGVTYDANTTLATNGFYKAKYVVRFDINGGTCGTAVDTAYYPFAGWARSADGAVAFASGETTTSAPNIATSGTGYLYAKWGAGTTAVTLPEPTAAPVYVGDGSYSFAGWYIGETRIGGAGASYTPTRDTTLTAVWTLTKVPSFDGAVEGTSHSLKVGGTFNFVFSNTSTPTPSSSSSDNFYYVITTTTAPTGNRDGSSYPNDVISISGNTITALNNGVATIKFYQKADAVYNIKKDSSDLYTFTVSRYSNTISCSWDGWSKNLNFDEEIGVTFSSDNNAYAPLDVTRVSGDVAVYDKDNHKFVANCREGSAVFAVSQAQDYMYEAATTRNCTINVGTLPNPRSYVYDTVYASDKTVSELAKTIRWHETGVADTLFLRMKAKGTKWGNNAYVSMLIDGSWQNKNNADAEEDMDNYTDVEIKLDHATKGLFFEQNGGDNPYVKSVRVSRYKFFDIKNAGGSVITSLTMPKRTSSGSATTATFNVHYSTDAKKIKLASTNSHITFANGETSYEFDCDTLNVKTITLSYTSAVAENITDAKVYIYTPYEHKTLTVSAQTKDQLATTIEYFGSREYSVTADNIAATSVFRVRDENGALVASPTITLTSSDSAKIDIVSVNTLDFKCGGSARITASYAGGGTYAAADLDTLITVNKLSDEIVWQGVNAEDGMIHVYAGSDLSNLVASAHTGIANYESGNADKLSVTRPISAFKISALKKGEVTLTATSAGDCEYESVSDTKTIKIDECPHNIVWNQNLVGLLADAEGNINDTIILTACAVDSAGTATNKPVTYSFEDDDEYARIHEDTLFVTGMAEVTINVTTAEDDKYAIAKASKRLRVRRFGDACGSEVVDSEEHAVGMYDNSSGKTYKNLPPSDKIYIKVGKYRDAASNTLHIYGYTDANCTTGQTEIASYSAGSLSTSGADKELDISAADYRSIKIKAGGTISKWFSDLRITQKTYLTASVSSISDDDITVGDAISKSFTVDYSDKPVLNYRYTGDYLSLTPNKTVDNDCGDYGTYTFTLSGSVPVASEIEDTIWITTSALDTICIPVALTVSAGDTVVFTDDNAEWSADETTATTPVTVSRAVTITEPVEAYSVTIGVGGSLTIAPTGGLTVYAGGISDATVDNLTLSVETGDVASHGQTGFLRVSPMAEMPQAKVQMLRLGYSNGNTSTQLGVVGDMNWQYVGAPIVAPGTKIKSIVGGWIYSWDEEDGDWINNKSTLEVAPFHGFANSQSANANGAVTNFKGQLVSNGTHYVDLAYTSETKGWNLLANSFAAPMDMTKMGSGCFPEGMDATVYLFNTGSTYNSSETQDGPGRYTTVPINLAGTTVGGYTYPTVIPSMQGFFVRAAAAETQMTFDYTRLVWNTTASNRPIRVRATNPTNEYETLFITLISGSQSDDVQIIANEDRFSPKFENGYDAHVKASAINIYTVNEDDEYLSVDATDRIIGTQIGIRTNDNMVYTMRFTNVHSDQNLALQDHIEDRTIELYEGAEYMFYAVPNSDVIGRFEIVQSYGSSQITTDIEDHQDKITVQKFIQDGQLYVLKDGVLYNAMGNRVR